MTTSRARLGLVGAVAAATLALAAPAGAPAGGSSALAGPPQQQTTPVVGTVIASPEPVLTSDGRNQLAYELQLINRSASTVTVRKVEALAGDKVVEKLAGKSLAAVMQPYGQSTPSDKLAPGEAGFVLMDVSLARKAKVPAELTHRIVISMKPKPTVPSALSYQLAPTKVTRHKAIVIHPPLYGPGWIIGNGCCSKWNYHRSIVWPVNGTIQVGERFAIDFVQLDAAHRLVDGPLDQLTSYPAFGAEVHSVAAGRVVSVRDGMPETSVGSFTKGLTLEEVGGNRVVIAIGQGRYAAYLHMQPGSIRVRPGERVKAGQTIGLLGNSGNSAAPHLHFQVMNGPLFADSNGIPYRFGEFNVVGTATGEGPGNEALIDPTGHGIRHDELPMDEQVVDFPEP